MRAILLVPAGFASTPSGGNVYDRHVRAGLLGLGWELETHELAPGDPLPAVPAGAVVLADSLVVSWSARGLLAMDAVVVPLVHTPFETPGERELLSAAPAVLVTSDWTRRWLVEHYRLASDRVHVAEPGVEMADRVSGTQGGGELLCVGTVTLAKGQDVLLAALARLTDLDWRCTLVGRLDRDPDFVDELHKAASDAGIADRLAILGALGHDDVAAAYAGADVLVHPSRSETYGMVVTEALARGLPVIASSVGGVPEALGRAEDDSVPGLLVRPDSPEALARSLRRWLEEPRRRARLRRSAGSRRLTLRAWSQTTSRVAGVLEGVS